ncbi:protein TonB [Sporomusaceae bacterium BoRhaA]|uniref:energy transducer TonB n=1 Tax=Pelorhabdus rhamnosifermentans TaxID=2772457 RepID=UPI001C063865|nr:TonB family protein [Pelorhabdus rhamnosifermentans]MBU2702202.1 protein TonB [Pelorhabdus rhamnosifermentans]
MNTQGTLSSWTKALFISIFCHSLFIFILFCLQTAPPDSQPEITELYEMDLTQSLADPSEPTANTPSDSVPPEDEQMLAINPSKTPQNEKKAQESEQNLNPPLPDIKPLDIPPNIKKNIQEPKVKKPIVKPIYPENFTPTQQPFKIILDIAVLESGQPIVIKVEQSSGNKELDNAAITAFSHWSYDPAINLDTGKPVSFFAKITLTDIDFTYPPDKNTAQQHHHP